MSDTQRLTIEAFGRSDAGAVARGSGRPDEDSQCVTKLADGRAYLCAVADGLGVRRGGSVASAHAVRLLQEAVTAYARHGDALLRQLPEPLASVTDYLSFVVGRIDGQLRQNAENNVSISGMASTLTAMYFDVGAGMAHAVHVGDSRLYRMDAASGGLAQVTTDDAPPFGDEFNPEPTAAVGALEPSQAPMVVSFPVVDGDVLLLCTDGLWREVDPPTMRRILLGSPSCALAVDRLIRAANLGGGRGNVAVVVAHVGRPALVDDEAIDRDFPPPGALPPGRERAGPLPTPRGWRSEPAPAPQREPAPVLEPAEATPPASQLAAAATLLPGAADVPPSAEAPPSAEPSAAAPPLGPVLDETPEPPQEALGAEVTPSLEPRAAAIASVPPQRPSLGPFVAGALCGAVAAAFLCVVVPMLWHWVFPPGGRQAQTQQQQPAEALADREIVLMPVWAWSKVADSTMRMCNVSYESYDPTTREESWQPLQYVRDNQPTLVTMFRDPDGLHLRLDVKYALDSSTKTPYGAIVTIKFRPDEAERRSVAVLPGRDAKSDQAFGVIRVTATAQGKARLAAKDTGQNLIQGGSAVAQLQAAAGGKQYETEFTNVPVGNYVVTVGSESRVVVVTPTSYRPTMAFGGPP